MTVLQLAAINLILISLIVCQTLSYDVDSFFFIFLSGHQTLLYVYDKTNYQWFRLLFFFFPAVLCKLCISLAIVLTIMFVYTFFF